MFPLGIWVYNFRDSVNIATGRNVCISIITIFREPLHSGRHSDRHCIDITPGHLWTYIDRNRIEIATRYISLYSLGPYQCCHGAYVYKYWLIRPWSLSFFHRFAITAVTVEQLPLGVNYWYNLNCLNQFLMISTYITV